MFYSVVFVKGEKDFSGDLPANPDTGAALGNDCCQVSAKKCNIYIKFVFHLRLGSPQKVDKYNTRI